MSLIRLEPPERPEPRSARIPLKHAVYWQAPFEDGPADMDAAISGVAPSGVPQAGVAQSGVAQAGAVQTRAAKTDVLQTAVSVFVSPKAFTRIGAHTRSDLDNEVGGWLVGKWRRDKKLDRGYIVVENNLPAPFTRQGRAFLTFTQDTQVALQNMMEERFPGKELVGWYHTHPRMGVFFSAYDTWLHENFFPEHYQVAMVIEPHSSTGGFFIRRQDGALDPRRYYGFYELIQRGRGSVVDWRNVIPSMK